MTRLVDRFDAVLFGMNGTIALGHARFSPPDDFLSAYRAAGGRMADAVVSALLESLLIRIDRTLRHPRHRRQVESLTTLLTAQAPGLAHRTPELQAFEIAFAYCERGHVPRAHAWSLRALALSHRLGIVANVWSRAEAFECVLAEQGLLSLFEARVWSSRMGAAKPALDPWDAALAVLGLPAARVLAVGDDPQADVDAPKRLGMTALWLAPPDAVYPDGLEPPDARAPALPQALTLPETALGAGAGR